MTETNENVVSSDPISTSQTWTLIVSWLQRFEFPAQRLIASCLFPLAKIPDKSFALRQFHSASLVLSSDLFCVGGPVKAVAYI